MKNILLLLLLTPILTFGQLKEFLTKKEINLQAWVKSTNNAQAIEQLKSNGLLDDYRLDDDPTSNFHLIDFDADGSTDLLFYGYTGGESKEIIFFLNIDGQYTEVFSVIGKLVYISDYKLFEPLSFAINQYGCCASINDVYEYYTPVKSEGAIQYKLSHKIALTKSVKFPNTYIDPKSFETVNPEYTLRAQPIINNQAAEHPDYDLPGNVLAVYPSGSIGTAIAMETDSTGRVWYFAIMKNNIKPIKEILFKGYNNDEPFYSMGWLSSRFIKEN